MKKLLLLSALLIFSCSSSDDSSNNDDNNNGDVNLPVEPAVCNSEPYQSIVIGTQEWTVENACHTTYSDGTPIPQVTDNEMWGNINGVTNIATGAWCYIDNDPSKGKLYNWFAIKGIHDNYSLTNPSSRKEFAPNGWHVPTYEEWETLIEQLISNGYNYDGTTTGNKIAKAMASTTGWDSSTNEGAPGNNQSLNNSSGFNAFPEKYRAPYGHFLTPGDRKAHFWSSTEDPDYSSSTDDWGQPSGKYNFYIGLDRGNLKSSNFSFFEYYGFSVRLIKD